MTGETPTNDLISSLVDQAYALARERNLPVADAVAIVSNELKRVLDSLPRPERVTGETPNPLDVLRAALEAQHPEDHDWPAALAQVEALAKGAQEVSHASVTFDDPRIEWVEAQIDREDLAALRAALVPFATHNNT